MATSFADKVRKQITFGSLSPERDQRRRKPKSDISLTTGASESDETQLPCVLRRKNLHRKSKTFNGLAKAFDH